MSLFRQGDGTEARKVATEAAARMKPLPADEKNPLGGNGDHDDIILWLAYKEAKAMIGPADPPPPPRSPPGDDRAAGLRPAPPESGRVRRPMSRRTAAGWRLRQGATPVRSR